VVRQHQLYYVLSKFLNIRSFSVNEHTWFHQSMAGGFGAARSVLLQRYFHTANPARAECLQIWGIAECWDTVLAMVPAGELQDRFARFKNTGLIVDIGYGSGDVGHSLYLILLLNSKVCNALIGFRHFDFSRIFCH
jgi:hypothetical protein